MISANRGKVLRHETIRGRCREKTTLEKIAEVDGQIDLAATDVIENFIEGLNVAVDVGQLGYTHPLSLSFRMLSCTPETCVGAGETTQLRLNGRHGLDP